MELDGRLEWPEFASTVKFWFAEQLLSARRDTTRARVPDELRPWFDETSAAMVAEVRRREYDVVGDLDDLLPVYGEAGATESPEPDEVVGAAAYALAEMLTERAKEPPAGAARMVQDMKSRLRGARRRQVLRFLPERFKTRLRHAAGRPL